MDSMEVVLILILIVANDVDGNKQDEACSKFFTDDSCSFLCKYDGHVDGDAKEEPKATMLICRCHSVCNEKTIFIGRQFSELLQVSGLLRKSNVCGQITLTGQCHIQCRDTYNLKISIHVSAYFEEAGKKHCACFKGFSKGLEMKMNIFEESNSFDVVDKECRTLCKEQVHMEGRESDCHKLGSYWIKRCRCFNQADAFEKILDFQENKYQLKKKKNE